MIIGIVPVPKLRIKEMLQVWRKVLFLQSDQDHQPKKKDGQSGKGSVVIGMNVKKLGCVSQDIESPTVKSTLRTGRTSSRSNLRLRYTPDAVRSIKIRERKGPSLENSALVSFMSASFFAPKFEDRSQEETLKSRAMGSQRSLGLGTTSLLNQRKP